MAAKKSTKKKPIDYIFSEDAVSDVFDKFTLELLMGRIDRLRSEFGELIQEAAIIKKDLMEIKKDRKRQKR